MKTRQHESNDRIPAEENLWGAGPAPTVRQRRRRTYRPTEAELRAQAAEFEAAEKAAREAEEIREVEERRFWTENRQAMTALGRATPSGSGRRTFASVGCIAVILRLISEGAPTRDDILTTVRREYRYSYRHTGFILTKLTGTDPAQHLWSRDESRRYHLLPA